jgi:hypothetical protein
MPVIVNTPARLVLKSGSTTLTLDREAGKVSLQRKVLLWALSPSEASLSEISEVTTDKAVDRAAGVEIWHTLLVMKTGQGWSFPSKDKQDAQDNASAIRQFLGQL